MKSMTRIVKCLKMAAVSRTGFDWKKHIDYLCKRHTFLDYGLVPDSRSFPSSFLWSCPDLRWLCGVWIIGLLLLYVFFHVCCVWVRMQRLQSGGEVEGECPIWPKSSTSCATELHIKLGRKSLIFAPSCLSFRHIWRTVKTNTMFAVTWLWWQVLIQMEKRRAELKRLRRFSYLSLCCTVSFSYRGVKSSEDKNNNL